MQYRSLGRTGVQVSAACLGTSTFGQDKQGWGCNESDSHQILDKALELGINFIDTANTYSYGNSERYIGNYLKLGNRQKIILSTKCHFPMDPKDPNSGGSTRVNIIHSCEASLKRLQTDYIDLYQLHRPHPSVSIDESLCALDNLIKQGKVRYIGCSTFSAWQVCEAHYISKELGTNRFISEQPPYNLLDRRIERELLPFCQTYNLAVIPWSPLAMGQLSGKYLENRTAKGRLNSEFIEYSGFQGEQFNDEKFIIIDKLKRVADKYEMSLKQMSLAWVASQPGITCPIIGVNSLLQLEKNVQACQIKLDDNILNEIDKIAPSGSNISDYYKANFEPNARPN